MLFLDILDDFFDFWKVIVDDIFDYSAIGS